MYRGAIMNNKHIIGFFFVLPLVALTAEYNPAHAQHSSLKKARFEIVKYNHADAVVDLGVGLWAQPLPMDYDHDGKTDMLVNCSGTPYNGIYFFKNISGGLLPVFQAPVRLSDGLNNLQISFAGGQPEFMIPGAVIKHFSQSFGREKLRVFAVDSLVRQIKKVRANQWKLVDYDGDGDLDVLVGLGDWGDYGWDNAYNAQGKWTNGPLHGYVFLIKNEQGHYVDMGKLTTVDGQPIDVYGAPSPNLADFDGDGDLDLICGEFLDKLTWFENTGTRQRPLYQQGRLLVNDKGVIRMPLEMINPVAFDWDSDNHTDLIVGQEDGRVALIQNSGRIKNHMPVFKDPVFFRQQADDLKFGVLSTPYGVDWDHDGKEDIICGNSAGNIAFIKNLGGYPPSWAPPELLNVNGKTIRIMAGDSGSIQGPAEAKWGYTTLSVADWDGDGLKDIVVNSIWGRIIWFKNTGTPRSPRLSGPYPVNIERAGGIAKPEWNWWNPRDHEMVSEWRTTPYVMDWNKDGLMDLVMLDHQGYLSFFKRIKKGGQLMLEPGKRIFYGEPYSGFNTNNKVTDSLPGLLHLNTGKYGSSGRRKFCMTDWDGDGKMDLLVNSVNVSLMKRVATKGDTVIFSDQGPLTGDKLAGHTTSPTIVDWDGDGIADLLVGAEDGHFYYMRNPLHK